VDPVKNYQARSLHALFAAGRVFRNARADVPSFHEQLRARVISAYKYENTNVDIGGHTRYMANEKEQKA